MPQFITWTNTKWYITSFTNSTNIFPFLIEPRKYLQGIIGCLVFPSEDSWKGKCDRLDNVLGRKLFTGSLEGDFEGDWI